MKETPIVSTTIHEMHLKGIAKLFLNNIHTDIIDRVEEINKEFAELRMIGKLTEPVVSCKFNPISLCQMGEFKPSPAEARNLIGNLFPVDIRHVMQCNHAVKMSLWVLIRIRSVVIDSMIVHRI